MREIRTSGSVGAPGRNPRGDPTLFRGIPTLVRERVAPRYRGDLEVVAVDDDARADRAVDAHGDTLALDQVDDAPDARQRLAGVIAEPTHGAPVPQRARRRQVVVEPGHLVLEPQALALFEPTGASQTVRGVEDARGRSPLRPDIVRRNCKPDEHDDDSSRRLPPPVRVRFESGCARRPARNCPLASRTSCGGERERGHAPALHVLVAKSAMIDGVAVSKPTTSSMPASSGSAIVN